MVPIKQKLPALNYIDEYTKDTDCLSFQGGQARPSITSCYEPPQYASPQSNIQYYH